MKESLPNLLTINDVLSVLGGISKRTIQRLVASGQFPKPIKVGSVNRWMESDIRDYLTRAMKRR